MSIRKKKAQIFGLTWFIEKGVLQTLAHFLDQLRLANGVQDPEGTCQEIVSIYETLTTIDPYRKGRYQDASKIPDLFSTSAVPLTLFVI